jgi:hypothetical protein
VKLLSTAIMGVAALGLASLAAASPAVVGPMTGGNLVTLPTVGSAPGATVIAIDAPVTSLGALDTAIFGWSAEAPCATVRIKVFRPTGEGFDFLAERGPYPVSGGGPNGLSRVALSPAILVAPGDVLGISGGGPGSCGNPVGTANGFGRTVELPGDFGGSFRLDSNAVVRVNFDLALYASGTGVSERFAGVLAGVGSVRGAAGSDFKTQIQIVNPYPAPIRGRMIFHPAGLIGSATDPSLGFSLEPGEAKTSADIVAALDLSGLWSVDVYTAVNNATPLVIARVFDDAGEGGTTGFTEPLIDPAQVPGGPSAAVTGALVSSPDRARYRFNVGIRTLGGPVGVAVSVKDASGTVLHTGSSVFPANFFTQLSSRDFLGGFDLDSDETLVITFSGGAAIFYGATTDNVTNDPSVQIMPYLFAVPIGGPGQ